MVGKTQYAKLQQNNNLYDVTNLNDTFNEYTENNLILEKENVNIQIRKCESVYSIYNKKTNYRYKVLSGLDILISFFLIGPCVVATWRGLWELMIIYNNIFPPLKSFLVGNALHLVFALVQHDLQSILKEQNTDSYVKSIILWILLKVYICLFFFTTLLIWYGGWGVFDEFTNLEVSYSGVALLDGSSTANIVTGCIIIVLASLKLLKNIMSVPFEVALDIRNELLVFPTYFKAAEKTSLYILDCLFSVLIVGTLVVFVWRGAWVLIDIFLFPDDEKLSSWGSLVIGYACVAIAFLLQPLMRWICDRVSGALRLLVADLFVLFAFFGTVNVWRGIWNLLNLYFLPDNLELSCWITHWVCLLILILLGCSNSLLVRGVYIDAEEPAGKCVVFPCHYLRIIFQEEKPNKKCKISLQEHGKTSLDGKVPYENNHVINVTTIGNTVENHTKL